MLTARPVVRHAVRQQAPRRGGQTRGQHDGEHVVVGGTGPRCRESTPSAGLSLSSHQPARPSRVVRRSWRASPRASRRRSGPDRRAPGRTAAPYAHQQPVAVGAASAASSARAPRRDPPRVRPQPRGADTRSSVAVDDRPVPDRREDPRCSRDCSPPPSRSHAHCDLPCGVYDPAQARIEAESIKAIIGKVADNDDPDFRTRAILIKEQRSELVKHHLWVLWTDYFKPPHFEKYPQLHTLVNEATKLAGATGTKGELDAAVADELLAKIDEIAEIFWETKKA